MIGAGRVAVIDDFRTVTIVPRRPHQAASELGGQDKGHRAEIAAFAQALADGVPAPIPWDDLRAVTLASILAVRSLRVH